MNTKTGAIVDVGIGFITNVRGSFSLVDLRLLPDFFFGVFRNDDLKLPLRGSFTIHDGGTTIFECSPEMQKNVTSLLFLNGISSVFEERFPKDTFFAKIFVLIG
jgi:hypothetical protein